MTILWNVQVVIVVIREQVDERSVFLRWPRFDVTKFLVCSSFQECHVRIIVCGLETWPIRVAALDSHWPVVAIESDVERWSLQEVLLNVLACLIWGDSKCACNVVLGSGKFEVVGFEKTWLAGLVAILVYPQAVQFRNLRVQDILVAIRRHVQVEVAGS